MTRIVKGSLRYKSAPDVDLSVNIDLHEKQKEQIQNDRNINIDKAILFDQERQISTKFRPTAKISFLFENKIYGQTNYGSFLNNMNYENFEYNANLPTPLYIGYPPFSDFDFIRTDVNIVGYTQPPCEHVKFVSLSATTYNWGIYLSYPFSSDTNANLSYTPRPIDNITTTTTSWNISNGIPYVVKNINIEGENLISFICPVKHNLKVGEFVKLNITLNGSNFFEVYSLGDGGYGSEEYIFNILNYGFGQSFTDGYQSFFKRISNIDNPIDSESIYYIRKHKIITKLEEAQLNKAGFENLIYGQKFEFATSSLTPDNQSKVLSRENSQAYTVNFSKDIDIKGLLDNRKRPLSELFLTIFHRGYFGWFYNGTPNGRLKQGLEFNLPYNPNATPLKPDTWWQVTLSNIPNMVRNSYVKTNCNTGSNTSDLDITSPYTFYYMEPLPLGFIFDGDLCEWNNLDQKEYVLSDRYHKFMPNNVNGPQKVFYTNPPWQENPYGYYYKPLYKFQIREYSPYIEEFDKDKIDQVPDYSFYSKINETFIWRDLYTYGFIDSEKIGVDYPFLNGAHYPYQNFIFRLIPEGTEYQNISVINDPSIDGCE